MKAVTIEEVLNQVDAEGELTFKTESGRVYRIKAVQEHKPFDPSQYKKVKMPGITREELIDSVRECREQGYK